MSDAIEVKGLVVTACHGVLDFEKTVPQPFVFDIRIEADLQPAGRSDDLTASLSYADVAAQAVQIAQGEPVDLIETLAERVAVATLEWPIVEAVEVTAHKPHAPAGVGFTPDGGPSVSIRRERQRDVVIAMGTNLGRRVATMRGALVALREIDGLVLRQISPIVETDPIGGVDQPDYLNAVVVGVTRLTPEHLLRELHVIEAQFGRVRNTRWGARTLDLDLIAMGPAGEDDEVLMQDAGAGAAEAMSSPLALPHPRAHERGFVVLPWAQAAPWANARTPHGIVNVVELAAAIGSDGVRQGPSWNQDELFDENGGGAR